MSQFVKKASTKIGKLSDEEILRIIDSQNTELKIRNAILDNLIAGCLMVSPEGSIMYMNPVLNELTSLSSRKKYTGVNYTRVFLDTEVQTFIGRFVSGKEKEGEEFFETEIPGGGTKSINCKAMKLSDPVCSLFVFRDITFFNRFKEECRKNESLAQMTTMAAGVAHEIKNPLASISIYLQLMEKMMEKKGSMTCDEARKYLDVVEEEVERINRIAVDFLFAVKPMKVNLTACNMNDIVQKTVNVAGPELKEKGIRLGMHRATSLPKVFADPALMEQSLLNLVKNAMQAMPEDRKDPRVTISTYIESDMVKLSVQDNGCGMTEDQMSKIFEPYYTTKSSGTGLGLTVLFKIMKQHGGDVTVHSTYGEGSEFILQVPVPQNERFRLTGSNA